MAEHVCVACGHRSAAALSTCGRCGASSSAAPAPAALLTPAWPLPVEGTPPSTALFEPTVARSHLVDAADDGPATATPPARDGGWHTAAPSAGPSSTPTPPRVDIGARVLAYLVDTVVVIVVLGLPLLLLGFVFPDPDPYAASTSAAEGLHDVLVLGWSGVCLFAYVWTVGVSGQTVGKRLLGQQVVDVRTGEVIGLGRSLQRLFIEGLTNVACYAGMWSAFLDSGSGRYQAWHDKACSTWVVSVPRRGIDSTLWSRPR